MPALETITDARLCSAVDAAQRRVVLIAPGIWPSLAQSIATVWPRLGKENVTVILDVDPEICRIGYGSLEGLEILQNAAKMAGEALGQEPGVRICVAIIDDQTFVFSPTPRQLEAPPENRPVEGVPKPKGNGIVISQPIATLEAELGSGPDGATTRTLGLEPLSDAKVKAVKQNLETNPPKQFDLSRAVNVYNAKIQFVELKVKGCQLSAHTATLPDYLLQVLKKNPDLEKKITKSIRLIDPADKLLTDPTVSQKTVYDMRDKIADKFLFPVLGIGTVLEKSRLKDFEAELEKLKVEVDKFAKRVKAQLHEHFNTVAKSLAAALTESVLANPPAKWKRKMGDHPEGDRVYWQIVEDVLKAFGSPDSKVGQMKVENVYKDVTYDTLKDPEFRQQIAGHFPELPLMEEYTAAKEREPSVQGDLFG